MSLSGYGRVGFSIVFCPMMMMKVDLTRFQTSFMFKIDTEDIFTKTVDTSRDLQLVPLGEPHFFLI